MAEYLLDVIHQDGGGAMSGGYDSTTSCRMGANVVAAPSTSGRHLCADERGICPLPCAMPPRIN
eukprot:scaffold11688_cov152-Skeletonema_dohrnii-CCMP3373.AAC.1